MLNIGIVSEVLRRQECVIYTDQHSFCLLLPRLKKSPKIDPNNIICTNSSALPDNLVLNFILSHSLPNTESTKLEMRQEARTLLI